MFVGNRGFAGLGYLGVSPNIHTTGTDHTSDVYASPSGMVGKEINGKWCLFKPPVGVTYETDYAGTVITVQNLGDGSYMMNSGGVTRRHQYVGQWRSMYPYWDAQGASKGSPEQCTAPGDPVQAYFVAGPVLAPGQSASLEAGAQNTPQTGTQPPVTPPGQNTAPPPLPPVTTPPRSTGLPPVSTPGGGGGGGGAALPPPTYQQLPPTTADFPAENLPASDGGGGMSGAIKWGLAALAALTLFK